MESHKNITEVHDINSLVSYLNDDLETIDYWAFNAEWTLTLIQTSKQNYN